MSAHHPDDVAPAPAPATLARRPEQPAPRLWLVAAAVAVIGVGLGATAVGADLAGGVLYAVLVALLIALVLPRLRPTAVGGLAALVCFTVEVAQLSGAPAAAVQAVSALRYVLGTTFDAVDLVAYLIGATLGAVVVQVLNQRAHTGPGGPGHDR